MTRVLCGGLLGAVATEAHGIELQDDGGFGWKAPAYFLQPGNPEVIYEQAWIEHSLNSPKRNRRCSIRVRQQHTMRASCSFAYPSKTLSRTRRNAARLTRLALPTSVALWASRFGSSAGTILVSLPFIRSISRIQTIPGAPISFAQA